MIASKETRKQYEARLSWFRDWAKYEHLMVPDQGLLAKVCKDYWELLEVNSARTKSLEERLPMLRSAAPGSIGGESVTCRYASSARPTREQSSPASHPSPMSDELRASMYI